MYYEHFGLTQAPFKITPNTDIFFTGANRGPVLEALIYAITHGEGIVKVSGEVGSGKTMLCNMLQSRLPDTVESVYLANPTVAPEDVLHAIAFELQLGVDRSADRLEVTHVLQDYLVKRHAEGKRVVVFIEESQSMPIASLEEIRLLSNLETRTDKLLQIVLFGQPELDEILKRPDIRQLRDRIAHSFRLEPLTDGQVRDYLMFRLRAAGYRGPELFPPAVVKQIAQASTGLTRRINLIADKALLAAFSENTHTIKAKHITAALRDSEFGRSTAASATFRYAWAGAGMLAGIALGAALYAFFAGRLGSHLGPERTPAVTQSPRASFASPSGSATMQSAAQTNTLSAPVRGPGANAPENLAADAQKKPQPLSPSAAGAAKTELPAQTAPLPPAPTSESRVQKSTSTLPSGSPQFADAASNVKQTHTEGGSVAPGHGTSHISNADIVTNRMEATAKWVQSGLTDAYSIQLFVAPDDGHLRSHLKALPKFIETTDLYMYRSAAQGKSKINVLWGSYDSRRAALEWLDELPPWLRANRPYVRSLEAIRAEMDRTSITK